MLCLSVDVDVVLRAAGYSSSLVHVREEFFGECRTVRGAANTDILIALVELSPAFASAGGVLSLPTDFSAGGHVVEVEVKGGPRLPLGLGSAAPPPPTCTHTEPETASGANRKDKGA